MVSVSGTEQTRTDNQYLANDTPGVDSRSEVPLIAPPACNDRCNTFHRVRAAAPCTDTKGEHILLIRPREPPAQHSKPPWRTSQAGRVAQEPGTRDLATVRTVLRLP